MCRSKAVRLFLLAVAGLALHLAASAQTRIDGDWQGNLKVDETTLRIVLHIKAAPDGGETATIDSLDQDSANIAVSTVQFAASTLKLSISQVEATFEGRLSKDDAEIKGTWTEGKRRALAFKRVTDPSRVIPPIPIGGDWEGYLLRDGKPRQIALQVDADNHTTLLATLDGMDGHGVRIPVTWITFTENTLKMSVDRLHASYLGAVNPEGTEIVGVWTQGHASPLTFRRVSHFATP